MQNIKEFSQNVMLRNGATVQIRAIRPDDKQRLLDGFHRLTGKSIYFRFLYDKHDLTEKELKYFTEVDFDHHVALVVTKEKNHQEEIVGVGRYVQYEEESPQKVAELAFAVDDAFQDLGICTLLFEHLVTIAQEKGISKLIADVLLENKNMLEIIKHSGFKFSLVIEKGVMHIEFDIAGQKLNRFYTVL
ncbi:GNAT family N-acetyltransferase [Sulfurovum zhangzhouensis]|nr:GNAT family N-acetyltransferase [Sulfurovum zhangzhouensis]